ncbi:hypothetical protein [Mesorhizobium sp. M0203]|uniref:hypothetical protein n=1 Tax=Mesorhizobium sp. M0203 TaxID=2956912 RepID=UPI003337FC83
MFHLARGQNVRALLFGRVRRLFLYVMPRFAKNSWTVVTPALTPRSARRSAISASVMSRSSVSTRARMNASCASSFESFGLPCRPGSSLPRERHSRYHAPHVEIPIENRRAAARVRWGDIERFTFVSISADREKSAHFGVVLESERVDVARAILYAEATEIGIYLKGRCRAYERCI